MKNTKALFWAFMKDIQMDKPKERGRRIKNWVLTLFAVFCVFLPVVVGSAILLYLMTKSLSGAGQEAFAIQLIYGLITVFTVIFSINVVFSELYFSDDIPHLLPLPLKGREIVGGKFAAAFMSENIIQFMLVLACVIGFGLADKMNPVMWILSFAGGFFLSVVPMAYCAILGILIMSFTKVVKSKDAIRKISLIFILVIMILLIGSVSTIRDSDIDNLVVRAASSGVPFIRIMNIIFPEIRLLAVFMAEGSIPALLGYCGITILSVLILLLVADLFYLSSVTELGESNHKKKKAVSITKASLRERSAFRACVSRDWKNLVRTPVYFTNCVAVTFIWPALVWVAMKILRINVSRGPLSARYLADSSHLPIAFLLLGFGVGFIMTSMNSLGSNAFSREGDNFEYMKYIPVSYRLQWQAKALISLLVSAAGTVPFLLFIGFYMKAPVGHTLLACLLDLLAIITVTYFGLLMDAMNPKLVWSDALSALRENENTFFCMGVAIVTAGALGTGLYFLSSAAGVYAAGLCGAGVMLVLGLLVYRRSMTRGVSYLEEVLEGSNR